MNDYKSKLCRPGGDKRNIETATTHEPKTMNTVYQEIQYHNGHKKMNYKERMEKNMQKNKYLMEELHTELCSYWQDFGFLSKSSREGFAKSLLPAIRVYHHQNINMEDEQENDDE